MLNMQSHSLKQKWTYFDRSKIDLNFTRVFRLAIPVCLYITFNVVQPDTVIATSYHSSLYRFFGIYIYVCTYDWTIRATSMNDKY